MSGKKNPKMRSNGWSWLLFAAGAVAFHCLLLYPLSALIYSGRLTQCSGLFLNAVCAFISCLAASYWQGRGEAGGTLRRLGLLGLGYGAWLLLLSALMNGRIMDTGVTPVIWAAGAVGALAGQVTKLCKSNKSYKIGIKKKRNIPFSNHP